jgi:Transposase zinc-binding domain/Putative transposase
MIELADIFRRHGPAYRAKFADRMSQSHLEAMEAIEQCRTEALDGHAYQGTDGGELASSSHAGTNRPGPKGQNEEATQWLEQQHDLLLLTPYVLVTSTRPDAWRDVARAHQETIYHLLVQPSAAALKELAWDPQDLGGQVGMMGVLQTWTREMAYHPPIHYLVPGGALSSDGSTWLSPR